MNDELFHRTSSSAEGRTSEKDILILGVGNLLLSDEGIGIHVAHRLQEMSVPPNVEIVDGGTGGFELLTYVRGKRRVIIIDALQGDDDPGTICRFTGNNLELRRRPLFSAHQSGIEELLHFSKELPSPPEVIIYGVIPKETRRFSTTLSPAVEQQIPRLVEAVLSDIGIASHAYQRRHPLPQEEERDSRTMTDEKC